MLVYTIVDTCTLTTLLLTHSRYGAHSKELKKFVKSNKKLLDERPTAFFSVSLSAAGTDKERSEATLIMDEFVRETGLQPMEAAAIAGAIEFKEYNPLLRLMFRALMNFRHRDDVEKKKQSTGRPGEVEFTDWQQVAGFMNNFLSKAEAHLKGKEPAE